MTNNGSNHAVPSPFGQNKMKRKVKGLGFWIRCVFFAPIVLCVGYLFIGAIIIIPAENAIGRSRILNSHKGDLLAACREVISNYDKYTNAVARNVSSLGTSGKEFELWNWNENAPLDVSPPLPHALLDIKPMSIVIGTNYLIVQPHNPPRTRILASSDGIAPATRYIGKTIMLTNGLFFLTLGAQ